MKKFKRIVSFFLTLIIALSCLMITAYADEINSSTPSGTSIVEYSVDPGWKATIPAYVKAADQGQQDSSDYTVIIYDVLLGDQQKLVATIDYNGILAEENGIQLKYSLYDSDGKIEPEKKFAEIPAGDPDQEYTYTFGAALDEKPKYAGNYLGTVMFNLSVEKDEKVYTLEEIEADEHLEGIGKTKSEYVIGQWNEDFTEITVFKNGEDSDGIMKVWVGTESPFYNKNEIAIMIKDGVTTIGNYAFYNCGLLTSLSIPDSVITIGKSAFKGCNLLKELSIPNSVQSIESSAFEECNSLSELSIPDSVLSIGSRAFYNCNSLRELSIPDSVLSIGEWAFYNCKSLIDLTISDCITTIGNYAFYNCNSLRELSIPDKVQSIGNSAFCNCISLAKLTIGKNVQSIGNSAFFGCNLLTQLTLPNNIQSIGKSAFEASSSITELVIPDSVLSIGERAFHGCISLTELTMGHNVQSIGDGVFFNANISEIAIPSSVKSIGSDVFGCSYTINTPITVIFEGTETEISGSLFEATGGSFATHYRQVTAIYGHAGSTAEAFAQAKGYTFIALDE